MTEADPAAEITVDSLINFEQEIAAIYEQGKIRAPIHLSGGNEHQLIEIFKGIASRDWVFSTWRSHYHALLHGIPSQVLKELIINGKSMGIISDQPKFVSSAIVGGCVPMAVGVALHISRTQKIDDALSTKVWCFVGDMCAMTGGFHEALKFSEQNQLPLKFIIEDNQKSVTTPTEAVWGQRSPLQNDYVSSYKYALTYPHHGTGNWIDF